MLFSTHIMANSTKAYTYKPLSAAGKIRILQLHPARDETTPLRCSLIETHISDKKDVLPYRALSYTWGAPIFPGVLHVDGDSVLRITENLATALRRLRDYQDFIELWVDAVCIDQRDEAEKIEQIELMGVIFQKAVIVLVWLGNFGEDSLSLLHDHTRRLSSHTGSKSSLQEGGQLGYAIQTILSQPWFRRRWVVQEVVLNANVKFICGHAEIEWPAFGRLVSELLPSYQGYDVVASTNREALQSVTKIFELWHHFVRGTQSRGNCSIVHLLQSFHFLQCYDPKDYLYTICRLAEDIVVTGRHWSRPDDYGERNRLGGLYYGDAFVRHHSKKSTDTKIPITFDSRISLQEAFVEFAYQLPSHGLFNWVLSQRLARMKSESVTWPSWLPTWNYPILRNASLIETVGSNNVARSRNCLLNCELTAPELWTAQMSHIVLPAYRYTTPLQEPVKQNMQDNSAKELAQNESNGHTSPRRNDDRLPWEIRWRSTTLPSSSDNTDQVEWLRTTYQNLLEQFRQMAQSFRASGESLDSYLETLLLQTLLTIFIEPLQTANAQIDDIESTDVLFYPVADSMQYTDPFFSLARIIESICRGCYPVSADMDTALKAVLKVLGSQCLFVAEYRSFENSSPALPAVHIGVASNDIAKGDKILSDGNTDFRTAGKQAGFIFRGNEDTTIEDDNLKRKRVFESVFRQGRHVFFQKGDASNGKEDTSGGIEFFSGMEVSRAVSGSASTRSGYVYEIIGHCLMVTPNFSSVWSYHTPNLELCEPRIKEAIFYLR